MPKSARPFRLFALLPLLFLALLSIPAHAGSWWDKEWPIRKKITLDLTSNGAPVDKTIGGATVLLRLHDGNFQFMAAKEDGSDLRVVAADDKTLLPYHIEKYDNMMNEAFIWVKLPEVKPGEATSFWLYYGNAGPKAVRVSDTKTAYDSDTVVVYHFTERNAVAADSTGKGHSSKESFIGADALIGGGARLGGPKPIVIPQAADFAWGNAQALTLSVWAKPTALNAGAILFSRKSGASSFVLGEENGAPYVEINGQRSSAGTPAALNAWHHVAVVAENGTVNVFLNGEKYGTLSAAIPALDVDAELGAASSSFVGDIDELIISNAARPEGWVKLAAATQGVDKSGKALVYAPDEQTHSWFEGGTFGTIIGNLTGDGWAVIIILMVMFVISWWLMITKIRYLNMLAKGNAMFMKEWAHLSSDLTALDHGDADSIRTLGGRATDTKAQRNLRHSSVYRIYHIGSEEIRHRLDRGAHALSARSIQAIRAALDGGQVREKQKIDRMIVLLTICISGGPFLGLLGTVVGVMITFAAVAAAGEVNVNAIAPGIAAALLATVAGLAVAIPSLFGYNYILARVKDATADMHVFIDEFIAKMAEFYSGEDERRPARGQQGHAESRELESVH